MSTDVLYTGEPNFKISQPQTFISFHSFSSDQKQHTQKIDWEREICKLISGIFDVQKNTFCDYSSRIVSYQFTSVFLFLGYVLWYK